LWVIPQASYKQGEVMYEPTIVEMTNAEFRELQGITIPVDEEVDGVVLQHIDKAPQWMPVATYEMLQDNI